MVNNIRLATLNARLVKNKERLVKNKDLIISHELNNHEIDTAVITETWLIDNPEHEAWTNQSELTQGNYKVKVHNRPGPKKEGGIVLIHKGHYPVQEVEKGNTIKHNHYRVCSLED